MGTLLVTGVMGATLTHMGRYHTMYISFWWGCYAAMRAVRTSRNLFTSDFLISITRGGWSEREGMQVDSDSG